MCEQAAEQALAVAAIAARAQHMCVPKPGDPNSQLIYDSLLATGAFNVDLLLQRTAKCLVLYTGN